MPKKTAAVVDLTDPRFASPGGRATIAELQRSVSTLRAPRLHMTAKVQQNDDGRWILVELFIGKGAGGRDQCYGPNAMGIVATALGRGKSYVALDSLLRDLQNIAPSCDNFNLWVTTS